MCSLRNLAQPHVHWVSEAIQPSHPLSPPFPPALNLSQHQVFSQWVSSSHQVAKVLELQHQSFQWIFRVISFRIDWFDLFAVQGLSIVFSSITIQNSSSPNLLYGPVLTSIHDYWKNHSFDHTDLCQQSCVYAFEYAVYICHSFFFQGASAF